MRQVIEYLRRFGRFQRNVRLYLLQSAQVGIVIGLFTLLYPLYLSALGYKVDLIGLVLFFIPLGTGVAIIPAGICIDRISHKSILVWSNVAVIIAAIGQVFFHDLVLLCCSACALGIGFSFQYVLNAPFLTMHCTPDERAHVFSLSVVLMLVTAVLGQLVGGALPLWLLSAHPWTLFPSLSWLLASQLTARSYQMALFCGVLIALTSFIPLLLMSADRPTRRGSEKPLWFVLLSPREIWLSLRKPSRTATLTARETTEGGITLSFWQRLSRFLLSPLVIMTGSYVLANLGSGILVPYLGLFFVDHLGANSALFGILSGSSNGVLALATLLAPWLVMRIGRLKTIVFTSVLSIPVLLCIGSLPFLLLAVILYPLYVILWDMSNGILGLFGMEVVPSRLQGRANSSYLVAAQVASAIGTPIGGLLIGRLGYPPVFWVVGVLFFLSEAVIWWRFAGKRLVPTEASLGATESGQKEDQRAQTSDDRVVSSESDAVDAI